LVERLEHLQSAAGRARDVSDLTVLGQLNQQIDLLQERRAELMRDQQRETEARER